MVEWSKDLYTNPHIVKKLQNNIIHNNSETELQSLVQDISIDDPLEYEKVKQHKHVLEDGIRLFNHKPKKGLLYFVDRNIIENSLESKAAFLHAENSRLDKTALGEFLGEKDFHDLMQAYVDMMNFSNMDFLKVSGKVTLSSNRPFQKSNVHFRIVDFRIFLPLTSFFMKTILEIVEVQKLPFFQFQSL